MFKRVVTTALAVVGLMVGAGFASGREVIQYYVSFGQRGLIGAILAAVLFAIMSGVVLQLGSYFRAKEHSEVFNAVTAPVLSRLLDIFINFTLFCTGFVMIAGAGSNLAQQFNTPVWVGSAILCALVIACGFLDVPKVTSVIGAATPFIIVFIVVAATYTIWTAPETISQLDATAAAIPSTLPHWTISFINYVAMGFALAVSMAIVMGGAELYPRTAGIGGLLGGGIYGALLVLSAFSLFYGVREVADAPMPMLALVNTISPTAGIAMALIIFAMIFNTAIGMYYALASRIAKGNETKFRRSIIVLALAGFVLSFFGFKTLVGYLFPIIGYVGILLSIIIVLGWYRARATIALEIARRLHIRDLLWRKFDRKQRFSKRDQRRLDHAIRSSNITDDELRDDFQSEVCAEVDADEEAELDTELAAKEGVDSPDAEAPITAEAGVEGSEKAGHQ